LIYTRSAALLHEKGARDQKRLFSGLKVVATEVKPAVVAVSSSNVNFYKVASCIETLDEDEVKDTITIPIIHRPGAAITIGVGKYSGGFFRSGFVARRTGCNVHFYLTRRYVADLDEDEIGKKTDSGGHHEPSAVSFKGKCGPGFQNTGPEIG
jgi:hypothetical protein